MWHLNGWQAAQGGQIAARHPFSARRNGRFPLSQSRGLLRHCFGVRTKRARAPRAFATTHRACERASERGEQGAHRALHQLRPRPTSKPAFPPRVCLSNGRSTPSAAGLFAHLLASHLLSLPGVNGRRRQDFSEPCPSTPRFDCADAICFCRGTAAVIFDDNDAQLLCQFGQIFRLVWAVESVGRPARIPRGHR